MSPYEAFAAAFNDRDLQALGALLADDAWAEVLGAPFPREVGRDAILSTSFPYLLEADPPLAARVRTEGERIWLLLCVDGVVDTAIRATVERERVTSLEYVVGPHRPDELRRIGRVCDLPTVADA